MKECKHENQEMRATDYYVCTDCGCELLPLVDVFTFPATVIELVYDRHNREADSNAKDEHERLIKDGWTLVSNKIDSLKSWKATYFKKNA